MKLRKKPGCVVVFIIFILSFFALKYWLQNSLPSAPEMRVFFTENSTLFEDANNKITAKFVSEDKITSAESGSSRVVLSGDEFITKESKDRKIILWAEVLGVSSDPNYKVRYYTHQAGIGTGAFGRGIAFLNSPPQSIYPDFEAMHEDAAAQEGFVGYCNIMSHWYSFLWISD